MLGMGPMEIAVILVIALIIFGPGKLPEIGQTIGRAVRDFRSATQDITGDFKQTMDELQETADDFKNTAMEFQQEAEDTFNEAQGSLVAAAKDIEDTTADTASEVSEGLSLDQIESPATKPSAKTEARIAEARDEYKKPKSAASSSSTSGKKATAKSGAAAKSKSKSSTRSTAKDAPDKSAKSKTSSTARAAAGSKKKSASSDDRERPAKKRRQREPATVSVPSSASKEDPLGDLMGVDDGPIVSSRSRGNGSRG